MKSIKFVSVICLMAITTLFIHSCSKSDAGTSLLGPGTHTVAIQAMAFAPATVTLVLGDQVTWTNTDTQIHTVVSDDGTSFSSGNINPGGTYSVTISQNGSYPYHCSLHPAITGTLQVVTR